MYVLPQEVQGKLKEMDEKLKSEGARVDTVKKENMDQLRSSKAEIKSLTEKIERRVLLKTPCFQSCI